MAVEKLNVLSYITQRIPQAEAVLSATNWFRDEEMTLDFGEYVGRPNENALMHSSLLTYFLANGWRVAAVMSSGSSGEWKSVASAESTNYVASISNTHADSSAEGHVVTNTGAGHVGSADTQRGESDTTQSGSSNSRGDTTSNGNASSSSESSGAPYWYAYQRIRLTRRKMQSELVLNDMIASFTRAYNEGRTINNARYDELVALYAQMLTRTEDEANALPLTTLTPDDFKALSDELAQSVAASEAVSPTDIKDICDAALASIRNAITLFKDNASTIPATWLASREADINRKFDASIAKARQTMIANGTYNGTTWPNVESGYERDRQYALTDLADSMVGLKVDTYGKIATLTADSETKLAGYIAQIAAIEATKVDVKTKVAKIRSDLMDSAVRVTDALRKSVISVTELRNTVLKWMFDFMERREDDYPGLEQLATIADRLGYSDGAVGGSIAS